MAVAQPELEPGPARGRELALPAVLVREPGPALAPAAGADSEGAGERTRLRVCPPLLRYWGRCSGRIGPPPEEMEA